MSKKALPPLQFPFGGVDETSSYRDQPPGTCSDALNVRPYDSLKARKRGGQRAGQVTTFAALNGSNPVQNISSVALAYDSTTIEASSTPLTRDFDADFVSDGDLDVLDPGIWELWTDNFASRSEGTVCAIEIGTAPPIGASRGAFVPDACANAFNEAVYAGPAITLGSKYILTATIHMPVTNGFGHPIQWRIDTGSRNRLSVRVDIFSGDLRIRPYVLTAGSDATGTIDSGSTTVSGLTNTDPQEIQIQANGNVFTCWVNGTQIWTWTVATFAANTDVGFGVYETTSGDTIVNDFKIQLAATPASLRSVKLLCASGGNLYDGTPASGLTQIGSGGDVVASGEVAIMGAFEKGYTADGLSTGYNEVNLKTRTVTSWQTQVTAGALPVGGTGTQYSVTAVDTGAKTFTVAEDLSSLTAGDFIEIRDSTGNDKSYTVASDSGTGPTVITVNETIPDATADGVVIVGDVGCRLLTLYRGRAVMSGLETDPQNWWMSAAQDLNDWDYFPATESETQAVAGNVNQAGKMEDIVTALMPYLDDVMYFGGDHTIWKLSGDPAAETGRFDNVSRQIGVVGPEAWTFDATGNLYFMGQNGLYRIQNGGVTLEQVGPGRLDDTFAQIDHGANRVRLLYDREWRGVHIFITPTSQGSSGTINYFWDERTDSFWPDQYPAANGPTAVLLYDADTFDDRAVYLGGFDSVIREFDRTADDDDGTAISSHVLFTPIIAGDRSRAATTEITVNLAEGSDSNAVLEVFSAGTAEDAAAETTPKAAKTLSEGRNTPLTKRVSGNVIQVKISDTTNDSSWALESGSVGVQGAGVMRREETS
jgi:hypothetical protein